MNLDLNVTWYLLIGVLLIGYAILDGFDLGVGALHLFARGDEERRVLLNSIGPVWDGNEVWLVTAGGALFAAFPNAYATSFSGFYLAFVLVLFMLIFRAAAIEFRSKERWRWWRTMWDWAFCFASIGASVLFGVAIGNMILGIPIGGGAEAGAAGAGTGLLLTYPEYHGTFLDLVNRPYPILIGLFNLSIFTNHGAIYLYLKTEGELQQKVRRWIFLTLPIFVILYMLVTIWTLARVPSMVANFEQFWFMWVIVLLNVLAIANIPRALYLGKPFYAFFSSSCTVAALIALFGAGIYPNLIRSSIDPAYNLTLYNSASSEKTLGIMLVIAILGMPFVIAYTVSIYWVFRGKTKVDRYSY